METLNRSLFLLLDAAPDASVVTVWAALLLAEGVLWFAPVLLALLWLRGTAAVRRAVITAALAAALGLSINFLIGLLWYHPRPFAIGLGRALIAHVVDSSFPSDHLTAVWAIAGALLLHRRSRGAGAVLAVLGLPMAWARIYLGVHYPLDMLGAVAVAAVSAWVVWRWRRPLVPLLLRLLSPVSRLLFAAAIRRGWVRR